MTKKTSTRRPGTEHGYGSYTNGCRCHVCREAKRLRQRALRAGWRVPYLEYKSQGLLEPYIVMAAITHGLAAYVNFFCRCEVCVVAKAVSTQRSRELKNNLQVES